MLALKPGDVFERDFRVVKPLSEGGMGTLFVVQQISTGKKRALKLMLKSAGNDEEARRRFTQEAQVGSLIESEHIVEVIAAGVDGESNTPWLVMELLEGEDLSSIVEREEELPAKFIHDLFQQLCHALGAAHDLPVVHRDLKPENIFLARSRVAQSKFLVKLLDFGIAKILSDGVNSTGSVGTPLWMAPEQAKPNAVITPASDVWALGLTAFYVIVGKPFWIEGGKGDKASVMALLNEVLFDPIPPASERAKELQGGFGRGVPKGFDDWFAHCVVRDPSARFPNAREAWRALEPILGGLPESDTATFTLKPRQLVTGETPALTPSGNHLAKTGGPVAISSTPQRRFNLGTAIVIGVTALALGAIVFMATHKPDKTEPATPTPTVSTTAATTAEPVKTAEPTPTQSSVPTTTTTAAATSAKPSVSSKPVVSVHPIASASTTAGPKPTGSNPLNMVLQ